MQGWNNLNSLQQLQEAIQLSHSQPVLLFKHSTRCEISSMAYRRLEKLSNLLTQSCVCYYLDLIAYRQVSNQIADDLNVEHQSPQVLLLQNGKCIYNQSHGSIYAQDILDQI